MSPFGHGEKTGEGAEPLLTLTDRKSTVELWPSKVVIRHRGMLNAMNMGLTGDKEIGLGSISAVQIKKPGMMTTGYIQFVIHGQESKSGVTGAVKDENSVLFNGDRNYEIALKIREYIDNVRNQPAAAAGLSIADELAKLAALRDQGILTDAEFDQQKRALLQSG